MEAQKLQKSGFWLGALLKPLRPEFREVVAMSLFINILALALPVFILQVYDRVVFYQGLATLKALVCRCGAQWRKMRTQQPGLAISYDDVAFLELGTAGPETFRLPAL